MLRVSSRIAGVGHFVPEKVVSNVELSGLMDTSDEWITERTGIKERRFIDDPKWTTASMGSEAARRAMEMAGVGPEEIDFIVFATLSPDYFFPGSGVLVQKELGLREVGALDVRNQCSGFVYALSVADQFIRSGTYRNILVIGSEAHSNGLDLSTRGRSVSVIFGDGAGAVLLQASDANSGILSSHLHSQGEYAEELCVKEPGFGRRNITYDEIDINSEIDDWYPYMNGNQVFKHAVTRFSEVIMEALNANGLSTGDIDLLIPHQANLRITQFIQKRMGLQEEKVYSNIQRYGNTTAASIPIALSEAVAEGKLKEGDLLCLAAFGSGFTWASSLIRW